MTAARDVVVVGGGLLGLSVALELARRGAAVTVVERGAAGDLAAAGGAAGAVDAQARPSAEPEPVQDLALLARHLYGEWVESIEASSGLSCEYDVRGGMAVARTDPEEVALDRALDWQRARGLAFEVLDAEGAQAREGALGEEVRSAFAFPLDGQLHAGRLVRSLALAARAEGVRLLEGCPAVAVLVEGGRAAGVRTASGRVAAGAVVDAAGPWAGRLPGAPSFPLRTLRAESVVLDASADGSRLSRFVAAAGVALIPRRDGALLVAGPPDAAPPGGRPVAGTVAALLVRAAALVPASAAYPFLGARAALCARAPDGVPLLGPTGLAGHHAAAGVGGIELATAPAAALLVADLVSQRTPPLPPSSFAPTRFVRTDEDP